MRLTIIGAPRTKKNSSRRIKRGKRVFTVPSEAAVEWQSEAISQLVQQYRKRPIAGPVSVKALIYRETDVGDLVGYQQAIGDALQGGHGKSKIPCVLVDDKQIGSWDGSRRLIDRANPRVEIEIEPMTERGVQRGRA